MNNNNICKNKNVVSFSIKRIAEEVAQDKNTTYTKDQKVYILYLDFLRNEQNNKKVV